MLKTLLSRFRTPGITKDDGKIRILIELSSFDKGGLEKVVLDSAIAFDRNRFDVTIVTPGSVGHLGTVAQAAGLQVIGLPKSGAMAAYERLIRKLDISVAMSHFSDTGYELFKKYNIPNITFIHNVYAFMSATQTDAFKRNDRFVGRYISVSKNATRYAVQKLGIGESKVVTIPNGLIIAEHEAREKAPVRLAREELGLVPSDYVFANIASYNLHKGHYVMIDAMRHLLQRRTDVKIICAGNVTYAPHVDQLRSYLKEAGLDKHVLLPGYFPNVEDIHRVSDAFLLPSFIEGWSIAMNEAMFYRKPMILTDTGAAAEVLVGEDIGILIPNEYGDTTNLDSKLLDELSFTPHEYKIAPLLADAMDRMATNRDEWRSRAQMGREKIYRDFDFADIVKRYEGVIESVAGRETRTI